MKLEITCKALEENLKTYKYNLSKFVGEIVIREDFKTFKDIEEALESYKVIDTKDVFNDEYANRVICAYSRHVDAVDYDVLVKVKGEISKKTKALLEILTLEGSLEEYAELNLHNIGKENTLAILKRECCEDSVLNFNDIKNLISKYKIVCERDYLDKSLYQKYDILSCDFREAVLIEKEEIK